MKRRREKAIKVDQSEELTLDDVICPACMDIFIEPVTLPCFHTSCRECLEKTVEDNKIQCMVCRRFIGSWLRNNKNSRVNEALWTKIKEKFPEEVNKKLNDEDTNIRFKDNVKVVVCPSGSLRAEYEEMMKKVQEEEAITLKKEMEKSAALIELFKDEDEKFRLEVERKKKLLVMDEELARTIEKSVEMDESMTTPKPKKKLSEKSSALRRLFSEAKRRNVEAKCPTSKRGKENQSTKLNHSFLKPSEDIRNIFNKNSKRNWLNSQCDNLIEDHIMDSIASAKKTRFRDEKTNSETGCTSNNTTPKKAGNQLEEDRRIALNLQKLFNEELKPKQLRSLSPLNSFSSRKTTNNGKKNAASRTPNRKKSESNKTPNQATILEAFAFQTSANKHL